MHWPPQEKPLTKLACYAMFNFDTFRAVCSVWKVGTNTKSKQTAREGCIKAKNKHSLPFCTPLEPFACFLRFCIPSEPFARFKIAGIL